MAIPFGQLQNFGTGSNPDWFGQFGGQVADPYSAGLPTTGQGMNENPYPNAGIPIGGAYNPAGGGVPPTSQQAADYAAQTAAQGFPAGSQPIGGGQTSGDPQAFFNQLFPGDTLSPDMLAAQEAALNAHGIKLVRNAAGVPGKIQLPDGSIVDVIQGAGAGVNKKQWLGPGSGGGSAAGGGAGGFGSLNFNSPYQTFQAPSLEDARNSPGYQFALQQGLQGVERGAASKGTLLTGGTLKALEGYGTGLADQTYGNVFNRAFQTNQANFSNAAQTNGINYGNLYNLASLGQKSAAG